MPNHKILVSEIETLAAHLGKSFAVTAKEYSIYLDDTYCVSSRLKYLRFYEDYNTAKKAMQYKEKVASGVAVEKQANTDNRDSGNPAELARTVGRGLGLGDDVEIWDEEEMENIRRRRAR